jgi:hypothetical protein
MNIVWVVISFPTSSRQVYDLPFEHLASQEFSQCPSRICTSHDCYRPFLPFPVPKSPVLASIKGIKRGFPAVESLTNLEVLVQPQSKHQAMYPRPLRTLRPPVTSKLQYHAKNAHRLHERKSKGMRKEVRYEPHRGRCAEYVCSWERRRVLG